MAQAIVKDVKDPWFERHFLPISIPLAKKISKTKITANHLTWLSLVSTLIAVIVLVLIRLGHLPQAAVIIAGLGAAGFWVLDTIDGKVARLQKKTSNFGAWLDVTFGLSSIYLLAFAVAFYAGSYWLGLLFAATYILKVFYCGTFQEYYKVKDKKGKESTPSYAPNSLARLLAEMNGTNTLCISVFVASIISYWWAPVFLWMEAAYILLNVVQSLAMVAIQYRLLRSTL